MNQVTRRDFNPTSDSGFLFDFWPKNAFYSASTPVTVPRSQWFKEQYERVKDAIKNDHIFIACLIESPETILGCSVISGECLEWIYVKDIFRGQGVEALLISGKNVKEANTATRSGKMMAEKFGLKEKHGKENRQAE